MFTGIVECQGRIVRVQGRGAGRVLEIEAVSMAKDLEPGDSVAVDGACLTVEETNSQGFVVTAVEATLLRTVAVGYGVGTVVNLERAARVGDRLDGHLVQGHVDGVGLLQGTEGGTADRILRFQIPAEVWRLTVPQGSITINGVSLTVQRMETPSSIEVAIIPYTWEHTNLGGLLPDMPVNVEGDLISKYVGRMLAPHQAKWDGEVPPPSPEAGARQERHG